MRVVGTVSPIDPEHRRGRDAERGEQFLHRRHDTIWRADVGALLGEPAALGAKIVLHVDDDQPGARDVENDVLRFCGN